MEWIESKLVRAEVEGSAAVREREEERTSASIVRDFYVFKGVPLIAANSSCAFSQFHLHSVNHQQRRRRGIRVECTDV